MKYSYLLGLAFLATSVFSQSVNWDAKLKEVGKYDELTERLTYDDGTWKKPKKDVLKALGVLKTRIQDVSLKMGVDPRAVAGAILAENSLNVSVSDGVQDFLVKTGIAKNGSVAGKSFSFGWGQLYMSAAREGEALAAKLENRSKRSDDEIAKRLLVPEDAVYYVAAVIRKVQDDYKAQGIDISKNPAILATLYNLGKSETKAAESKKSGKSPRVNFFGLFVDKYLGDLEKAVGKPAVAAPVVAQKPAVVASAPKVAMKKAAPKAVDRDKVPVKPLMIQKPVVRAEKTKTFQTVLTANLPLYQYPPSCPDSDNNSQGLTERYKQFSYSKVTKVMSADSSFRELAPAIDCESNPWVLIKSENGTGWVARKDLEEHSEKRLVEKTDCKSKVDPACRSAVNEATKAQWADTAPDEKSNVLFLNPLAANGKGSFAHEDGYCRGKKNDDDYMTAKNWFTDRSNEYLNNIARKTEIKSKAADAVRIEKIYDDKIKEINRVFKTKGDFYSAKNPYSMAKGLLQIKSKLQDCTLRTRAGLECPADLNEIETLLNRMKINENVSLSELTQFNYQTQKFSFQSDDQSRDSLRGLYAVSLADIKSKKVVETELAECIEKVRDISKQFASENEKKKSERDKDPAPSVNSYAVGNSPAPISTPSGANMNSSGMGTGDYNAFNEPIVTMNDVLQSVKNASEEETKKMEFALTRYVNACQSYVKMFNQKPMTKAEEKACDARLFPVPQGDYGSLQLVSEALAKKMIVKDSESAAASLKALMNGVIASYVLYRSSNRSTAQVEEIKSFCPNKTADYIEELLKTNKCIKMVYMPSRWVVNRLNEYSDQMMYRPFEEDDRYAIEFVGGCSK